MTFWRHDTVLWTVMIVLLRSGIFQFRLQLAWSPCFRPAGCWQSRSAMWLWSSLVERKLKIRYDFRHNPNRIHLLQWFFIFPSFFSIFFSISFFQFFSIFSRFFSIFFSISFFQFFSIFSRFFSNFFQFFFFFFLFSPPNFSCSPAWLEHLPYCLPSWADTTNTWITPKRRWLMTRRRRLWVTLSLCDKEFFFDVSSWCIFSYSVRLFYKNQHLYLVHSVILCFHVCCHSSSNVHIPL